MNSLQRTIIKNIGFNILCSGATTLESIKKDLTGRLRSQKKAFDKWSKKEEEGCEIEISPSIKSSIIRIETTLDFVNKL